MTRLNEIEGIGEVYRQRIEAAGISSTEKLLEAGSTPKGRKDLAEKAGVSDKLLLKWINNSDLFRIKGVGQEYADLLEQAGVDTVPELAQRKPENLHQKMTELNEQKKLVRKLPTLDQVQSWVAQAKELPRVIHY